MTEEQKLIERYTDEIADLIALRERYEDAIDYYDDEVNSICNRIALLNTRINFLELEA
jgi:hypothetical protein